MANSFVRDKFAWLNQVRADPGLTPLAFMLAYVLADLVNEREGCAWPSVAHLAAECRVTEKGVKKVIRRLVERGQLYVGIGGGRGRTNRYRWIIKRKDPRCLGGAPHSHEERGQPPSNRKEPQRARIHNLKRATGVLPFEAKKGNWRSRKGEPQFP